MFASLGSFTCGPPSATAHEVKRLPLRALLSPGSELGLCGRSLVLAEYAVCNELMPPRGGDVCPQRQPRIPRSADLVSSMGIHVHEPCVFEKLNEMVGDGIVKARVRPPAQEDLVEAQRFRRRYWIPGDALVVVIQNNHRAARFHRLDHRSEGVERSGEPLQHSRSGHDIKAVLEWQVIRIAYQKAQSRKILAGSGPLDEFLICVQPDGLTTEPHQLGNAPSDGPSAAADIQDSHTRTK